MKVFLAVLIIARIAVTSLAHENPSRMKRQGSLVCSGAVSGSVSSTSSSGSPVATVQSTDPAGQSVWYTITDPTFAQAFNINPYTGAISVGSNFATVASGRNRASFTVQTTNAAGETCSTPVTVAIGGSSGSAPRPSATVVDTCGCGSGFYCFQSICYPIFPSSSNTFTVTNCTAGTSVGRVSVTNTINYGLGASFSNFYINSNGNMFIGQTLSESGTYVVPIIAYRYDGSTSLQSATVTASCSGTAGTFCVGTFCFNTGSGAPSVTSCQNGGISILGVCFNQSTSTASSVGATFGSSSYQFTTSACTAGTTVGTIAASGATTYTINYGFRNFTITNAGVISLLATLPTAQYSISAVATTSAGFQTSVPVTVNVNCATG